GRELHSVVNISPTDYKRRHIRRNQPKMVRWYNTASPSVTIHSAVASSTVPSAKRRVLSPLHRLALRLVSERLRSSRLRPVPAFARAATHARPLMHFLSAASDQTLEAHPESHR